MVNVLVVIFIWLLFLVSGITKKETTTGGCQVTD
jgi:hypothetical protein